jgi:hypothetical protein
MRMRPTCLDSLLRWSTAIVLMKVLQPESSSQSCSPLIQPLGHDNQSQQSDSGPRYQMQLAKECYHCYWAAALPSTCPVNKPPPYRSALPATWC